MKVSSEITEATTVDPVQSHADLITGQTIASPFPVKLNYILLARKRRIVLAAPSIIVFSAM